MDILNPDSKTVNYKKISNSKINTVKVIIPNYLCNTRTIKFYGNSDLPYNFRFRLKYTTDFKLLDSVLSKSIIVKCPN